MMKQQQSKQFCINNENEKGKTENITNNKKRKRKYTQLLNAYKRTFNQRAMSIVIYRCAHTEN